MPAQCPKCSTLLGLLMVGIDLLASCNAPYTQTTTLSLLWRGLNHFLRGRARHYEVSSLWSSFHVESLLSLLAHQKQSPFSSSIRPRWSNPQHAFHISLPLPLLCHLASAQKTSSVKTGWHQLCSRPKFCLWFPICGSKPRLFLRLCPSTPSTTMVQLFWSIA